MKHFIYLWLMLLAALTTSPLAAAPADAFPDLSGLDSCIAMRPAVNARYERHLAELKKQLGYARGDHRRRLDIAYELFNLYANYQFDSAFVYVKQCQTEADECHDPHAKTKALLSTARLLASGGFYNQAEEILQSIDFESLPRNLRYDYAIASYWTYIFWIAFTMDEDFSIEMTNLRFNSLITALKYADRGKADWYYLKGEESFFKNDPPAKTIRWYQEAMKREKPNTHLYSQTAFAIARSYKQLNMGEKYAQYLIMAAKSDIMSSVKENAALQEVAMYLFDLDPANAKLAHHYLLVAMDDATFYNNKLRKLEISNRMPPITAAYQQQIQHQQCILVVILLILIILAALAIFLYILSRRRNSQLHTNQKLLVEKNDQLQEANNELSRLNNLLREANHKREEYLRLFVDICASTLNRINSYRNYVKLKVKANQTADLLRAANSERLAAQDMNHFYMQFDKAFLGLYPRFVDEFRKLLQPGVKVELNKDGSLTTELRIFAFIRLGVTESSEIATLLSYSPHTIYNYRSAMKSKAVDKEHFEEDVRNICRPK